MTSAELRALLEAGGSVAIRGASGRFHEAAVVPKGGSTGRPRGKKAKNVPKTPKPTASRATEDFTPSRRLVETRSSTRPYLPIPPIWFLLGAAAAIIWRCL